MTQFERGTDPFPFVQRGVANASDRLRRDDIDLFAELGERAVADVTETVMAAVLAPDHPPVPGRAVEYLSEATAIAAVFRRRSEVEPPTAAAVARYLEATRAFAWCFVHVD